MVCNAHLCIVFWIQSIHDWFLSPLAVNSGLVEAAPTITTTMAQTAGFDVHPFFVKIWKKSKHINNLSQSLSAASAQGLQASVAEERRSMRSLWRSLGFAPGFNNGSCSSFFVAKYHQRTNTNPSILKWCSWLFQPRDGERGGTFGEGEVVRTYTEGQVRLFLYTEGQVRLKRLLLFAAN